MKTTGQKFPNPLVNQKPVFDNRRRHRKPALKHSGNLPKKVKFLK